MKKTDCFLQNSVPYRFCDILYRIRDIFQGILNRFPRTERAETHEFFTAFAKTAAGRSRHARIV